MFAQAFGEAGVVWVGHPPSRVDERIQLGFELGSLSRKVRRGQRALLVTQVQGGPQDGGHVAGKAHRAPALVLVQFAQVFEQMAYTLLLEPGGQGVMIVGGEAIRDQNTANASPRISTTTSWL